MKLTEAYVIFNTNLHSMDSRVAEAIDRILDNKEKRLEKLDRLELSEAKGRMALEDAHQHIEQLEDILHAIKEFSGEYAPFNSAMAKIQQMAEEGLK